MKPLIYDPRNGYPIEPCLRGMSGQDFRCAFPTSVWYFNPWTGGGREVLQDPYGWALPDEGGIYTPVEKKTEPKATDVDFTPLVKQFRFQVHAGETSAEVISLLSTVMSMYSNITNAERGAVVSWFCERYRKV